MSSPESALLPRDADFGYEVIEEERKKAENPQLVTQKEMMTMDDVDADEEDSSVSVADHYRGTPPLKKGKKKRTNSSSHSRNKESHVRCIDIIMCYQIGIYARTNDMTNRLMRRCHLHSLPKRF